jgi:TolA-binding protein
VRLDVVKRGGADWNVRAGGYRVAVTGTSFSVEVDDSEQLSVDLFAGSVIVTGPLAPSGLPVNAGQRLSVEPANGRVRLLPLSDLESRPRAAAGNDPAEPSSEPEVEPVPVNDDAEPTLEPEAEPKPPVRKRARPRTRATKPAVKPAVTPASWPSRVAAGDFHGVLAEAAQLGLESVLHGAEREELQALADAARYGRQGATARGALSALRRRFEGSSRAVQAAFFLGRLAEAEGQAGEAIAWYGSYLVKEPAGPYAAEALGRKLAIVTRQGAGAAATQLAQEYLQRFPRGPHSSLAKRYAAAGAGASGP